MKLENALEDLKNTYDLLNEEHDKLAHSHDQVRCERDRLKGTVQDLISEMTVIRHQLKQLAAIHSNNSEERNKGNVKQVDLAFLQQKHDGTL